MDELTTHQRSNSGQIEQKLNHSPCFVSPYACQVSTRGSALAIRRRNPMFSTTENDYTSTAMNSAIALCQLIALGSSNANGCGVNL
ncbi:hypothetical protein CHS0354_022353 [Potamilus streckersoni]|uniref:Uncharacterized protein n=1 Tax=Potamilus streckersoni TaxID=2493646 RepID=A0AAE0T290_9BIVA|nr:hypothetical protein CHS0354_022353 [Potamilus streckersoni]